MRLLSLLVIVALTGAEPAVDLHGDPLPPGAIARLGTVRFRAAGCVGVVYSPDGKLLATRTQAGVVLLDARIGQHVATFRGTRSGEVTCHTNACTFSRDGRYLAAGFSAGPTLVWDIATRKVVCMVPEPDFQHVDFVGFTGAGGLIVCNACEFRLVDVKTGKDRFVVTLSDVLATTDPPRGAFLEAALSPDGNTLALLVVGKVAGKEAWTLRLFDAVTGKERRQFPLHDWFPGEPRLFSPDGKEILVRAGQEIAFCDPVDGQRLRKWTWQRHQGNADFRAITPDGKALLAESRLWDVRTGRQLLRFPELFMYRGVAFSPDGAVLAEATGDGIERHDTTTGQRILQKQPGHQRPISELAASPDGRVVATMADDGQTCLWDAATGRHLASLGLEIPKDPRAIWDRRLPHRGFAVGPEGKWLVTAGERLVLWDTATSEEVRAFPGHQDGVYRVVATPDGRLLLSRGFDGSLRLWETATGRELGRLDAGSFSSDAIALTADGKTAAVFAHSELLLFDTASGRLLRNLGKFPARRFPRPQPFRLAFSADGRTLASTCCDGEFLQVWDVASGRMRVLIPDRVKEDDGGARDFAFSPDGHSLLSAGNGLVRLWEVASGQERGRFKSSAERICFALNGQAVVTNGYDTTATVWRLDRIFPFASAAEKAAADLWTDLASADAGVAYRAIQALRAAPDVALPILKRHLRPVPHAETKQVVRWIADLDADDFDTRERAAVALARIGEAGRSAMTQCRPTSAEQKRRIGELLKTLDQPLAGDHLRCVRAIEALEAIGTMGACELLAEMAKGAPGAIETEQARAAMQRFSTTRP